MAASSCTQRFNELVRSRLPWTMGKRYVTEASWTVIIRAPQALEDEVPEPEHSRASHPAVIKAEYWWINIGYSIRR
jgi:hypothetical protein